jgi:hypothetical protein
MADTLFFVEFEGGTYEVCLHDVQGQFVTLVKEMIVEKLKVCDPAVFERFKFGYNNIKLYNDPQRLTELIGMKITAELQQEMFFMQSC